MQIKSKLSGGTLFVVLQGELDHHTASHVRDVLDDLFSKTQARSVIFDLSELAFIDSTGIGVFIGRYKKLKARSIPIYITSPSSHAEKIFLMSGIYTIMPKIS